MKDLKLKANKCMQRTANAAVDAGVIRPRMLAKRSVQGQPDEGFLSWNVN